jgi:hypothetical protein
MSIQTVASDSRPHIKINTLSNSPPPERTQRIDLSTASTIVSAREGTSTGTSPETASPQPTYRSPHTLIIDPDGSRYFGEAENYKAHGEGALTYAPGNALGRISYQGPFVLGQPQGIGVILFKNGNTFKGRVENGHMIEGTLTYPNTSYDHGVFQNQKLHVGTHHDTHGKTTTYLNGLPQSSPCCTIL